MPVAGTLVDPRFLLAFPSPMVARAARGIDLDAPLDLTEVGIPKTAEFCRTTVIRVLEERRGPGRHAPGRRRRAMRKTAQGTPTRPSQRSHRDG